MSGFLSECVVPNDGSPSPCEDGCIYGDNCTMVCTTLESQRTYCSYPCLFANDAVVSDCDGFGDNLQCLIIETNSETGFCSEIGHLWIAGIVMSLAGSLLSNLGLLTQKHAYNKGEQEIHESLEAERDIFVKMDKSTLKKAAMEVNVPEAQLTDSKLEEPDAVMALMREAKRKNPFCMPMWLLGFVGMVTGALLDFGSLIFAAQSLLAPLAASTLVINIVQAPCVVGEKPGVLDVACTIIIAVGCTLAVAFADHNTATYSLQEMLELWYNSVFVVWIIIVVVGMTAAYLVIRDGEKRDETGKSKIEQSRTNKDNFYPFVFAALGGQSGGNSILFAKSIGEVMKTFTQVGFSATDAVISLFMGAGLAICMFIQLKFLNNGLRLFDVLFVLPIYQAFWITGATVNGILFFEEYANFNDTQYFMFPIGCVLTVGGVSALAMKYEQSSALDATSSAVRSNGTEENPPADVDDVQLDGLEAEEAPASQP